MQMNQESLVQEHHHHLHEFNLDNGKHLFLVCILPDLTQDKQTQIG
jgi:hypothetical protein